MTSFLKLFSAMIMIAIAGLIMSGMLLHTHVFAHGIHPSVWLTVIRISIYSLIIVFWRPLVHFLLRKKGDEELLVQLLRYRWEAAGFFLIVEVLIIQGGFSWLIGQLLRVL